MQGSTDHRFASLFGQLFHIPYVKVCDQCFSFKTGETVQIRDLLRTLYEAACAKKNWGIVRHTAGLLGKRVEDLSKSVTDLLVRQKQVRNLVFFVSFLANFSKFQE